MDGGGRDTAVLIGRSLFGAVHKCLPFERKTLVGKKAFNAFTRNSLQGVSMTIVSFAFAKTCIKDAVENIRRFQTKIERGITQAGNEEHDPVLKTEPTTMFAYF